MRPFCREPGNLWLLHNLGTAYGCRPAEILGIIDDDWLAFQIDLAALTTGRAVEEAVSHPKRKRTVEQALAEIRVRQGRRRDGETGRWGDGERGRRYKPLRKPGIKKMRVPESGVW